MRKFSLAQKIALTNTVFALLACLMLALSANLMLRRYLIQSAQTELHRVATVVAGTLDVPMPMQGAMRFRAANRMVGAELVWVSPQGRILASSSTAFPVGAYVNVPLKDLARMTRAERWHLQTDEHVYALAELPGTRGFLMAVAPLRELRAVTAGIMSIFIPISVVVVLAGTLLGSFWTGKISKPVQRLASAAHQVANGNYRAVPRLAGDDEIAELSHALHAMALQLQAGEEAQREFVQNASHELKTPLMNIQGYAEALKDGIYSGDEAAKCLDVISRETVRMQKLVNDMIYLSTITARPERLVKEDVRLRDLFGAAEESTRGIVVEAGRELAVSQPPDIVLAGDFDKLVRALTNLIANATRYARRKIELSASAKGNTVTITVRDDGPGIDPTLGEQAFERFSRGEGGQTGLGLAIVKAIVVSHGGTIAVTNDHGAMFTITLPARRP